MVEHVVEATAVVLVEVSSRMAKTVKHIAAHLLVVQATSVVELAETRVHAIARTSLVAASAAAVLVN